MEEIRRVLEKTGDNVDRKLEKIERPKEEYVDGGKEENIWGSDKDQAGDGKRKEEEEDDDETEGDGNTAAEWDENDGRWLPNTAAPAHQYFRPCEMLQLYNMHLGLPSIQADPVNIYGPFSVCDCWEPCHSDLFKCLWDYPPTIAPKKEVSAGDLFFCSQHKQVEGRINIIEKLRSVILSVSKSLRRLGVAPQEALWKRKRYFIRLQGSLKMGIYSLSVMELALCQLKAEVIEKAAATATSMEPRTAAGANRLAALKAASDETRATSAFLMCDTLSKTCRATIASLQAVNRIIGVKLSGAQGGDAHGKSLTMAILHASTVMTMLACHLQPCMQIINALEGMPPTIKHALNSCRKQLMPIKASADGWFLILGIGAFSFRKVLNKGWRKLIGAQL